MVKAGKTSTAPGLTRNIGLLASGLILWGSVAPAWAAQPTVAQMLGYRPRQEGVEPVEHGIGLRLTGERGEHARQQLRQQFARPGRAQCPHMPGLPAAHG